MPDRTYEGHADPPSLRPCDPGTRCECHGWQPGEQRPVSPDLPPVGPDPATEADARSLRTTAERYEAQAAALLASSHFDPLPVHNRAQRVAQERRRVVAERQAVRAQAAAALALSYRTAEASFIAECALIEQQAAPVASPAEDGGWWCDVNCPCPCGDEPSASASPRREAPADAADDLHEALQRTFHLMTTEADVRRLRGLAEEMHGLGYQLVPAGHHVSPEGQTVIDGKRYGHTGKWLQPRYSEPTPQMRPVGTEEADTDG